MAKKKTKASKKEEEATTVADNNTKTPQVEEEEDDEPEMAEPDDLLQVELGDMVKLKQVLDETACEYIQQNLLPEDPRMDYIKLSLMALACGLAIVAQLAPIPFPESRPLLGACCTSYFILSGLIQYITTFMDMDAILRTRPTATTTTTSSSSNPLLSQHGVRIRSQFPRYTEWYTLVMEVDQGKGHDKNPLVEQKWSVGKFFDQDGYFDQTGYQKQVHELFRRLEQGKYDRNAVSSKKEN
eukprot:Nitzschia sp. Nitz4//scaffold154_size52827//41464//42186//NITZ4_006784-RA/size52827-processed-gene-0.89-mRNA-1//-1//CDS//3329537332//1519//frame0